MGSIPVNRFYKEVALLPDGSAGQVLSGELASRLAGLFAPNTIETQMLIVKLRQQMRWSRPQMSAILGLGRHALRRWELGQRRPNAAARKLIWFCYCLINCPEKFATPFDTVTWGTCLAELDGNK